MASLQTIIYEYSELLIMMIASYVFKLDTVISMEMNTNTIILALSAHYGGVTTLFFSRKIVW